MKRLVVVGVTGVGKTTLAEKISQKCRIPHVEQDSLYWGPGWTPPASGDLFRSQLAHALRGECWVTCGDYNSGRPVVWSRADTLIWLDYDLQLIFRQLFRRNVRRITTKQELWNGNRETWRTQFFTRRSLFYWAFKTHPKLRREYPPLLKTEYAHLHAFRFRHPTQTYQWLNSVLAD